MAACVLEWSIVFVKRKTRLSVVGTSRAPGAGYSSMRPGGRPEGPVWRETPGVRSEGFHGISNVPWADSDSAQAATLPAGEPRLARSALRKIRLRSRSISELIDAPSTCWNDAL